MRHLARLVLPVLVLAAITGVAAEEQTSLVPEICEADLAAHLRVLASDEMKGRETLSHEGRIAGQYIADQWETFGAQPIGDGGTWFQAYSIQQPVLKDGNVLEVKSGDEVQAFEVEQDWNPFSMTAQGDVEGDVVFAGYGINAPQRNWNDYADVDVRGKVVLVFRRNPGWREQRHATFIRKLQVAAEAGAAALLLVNDPATTRRAGRDKIGHWSAPVGAPTGSGTIPYAFVSQKIANAMLAPLGTSLTDLEAALLKDGPQSADVDSVRVHLRTALTKNTEKNARNVVGFLAGRDPDLVDEIVVVGAHYDHIGLGTYGSLGGRSAAGKIHNGADDNGSGSVTLLETVHWFAQPENRPRRSLVFIAFSGEERGLLGSQHYVDHPTVPLRDIVAMVNMDMVGRYTKNIQIGGVGTAVGLQDLVARHNETHGLRVAWDQQGIAPSDSTSFFRKKIPVLFFFTGLHKDYHRPSDDVDTINFADMVRIGNLVKDVVRDIGDLDEPLEFKTPPPPPNPPVVGIQPSPEPHPDGLAIAGVAPGGPAEKAGMLAGDVIVEIAGHVVRDRQSLMQILIKLKAGKTVKFVVLRGDERVPLSVTLAERRGRQR